MAAWKGWNVEPNVRKCDPYPIAPSMPCFGEAIGEVPRKTTVGKVLPRKNSRIPAMMSSKPPKK